MSRPPSIIRRISKNISLPEDIVAQMEVELFSEVDGRIPIGAQSKLIEKLLREHYTKQSVAAETFDIGLESAAKAIYATYIGASEHPWVEGGNSHRQDDARREARRQGGPR